MTKARATYDASKAPRNATPVNNAQTVLNQANAKQTTDLNTLTSYTTAYHNATTKLATDQAAKTSTPSSSSKAASCINNSYGYGSSGPCVVDIQSFINAAGSKWHFSWYFHLQVDGKFGTLTRTEVLKFENRVNLTQDGVVGPKIWHVICDGGVYMKDKFGSGNAGYVISRNAGCTNSTLY